MAVDPYAALGAYLTAFEAQRLATALLAGEATSGALKEIHPSRRGDARRLLAEANLGHHRLEVTVSVLQAITGARSVRTNITPVWTMPGSQATTGRLTSQAQRLLDHARMSVVCSSFNFTRHSIMWTALQAASQRPGVGVTVYLDAEAGNPREVAAHLPRAAVYHTVTLPGAVKPLVNHAKFIVVDHALTLLTSANFSYSAENTNVELGLLVHDAEFASSVESSMRAQHGLLYQQTDSPIR